VLSSYRAPLGCPTQQEYLDFVAQRSVTLRLTPEASAPGAAPEAAQSPESARVSLRIQPDTSSAGWVGALRIEGADALEREVRGERCQDVVVALALITVLRLDRRGADSAAASAAVTAPGEEPSAAAAASAAAPPSPSPAPAASSAAQPASPAPSSAAAPALPAPAAPPPTSSPPAGAPAASSSGTTAGAAAATGSRAAGSPEQREAAPRELAAAAAGLEPEPFEVVRRQRPEDAATEPAETRDAVRTADARGNESDLAPVLAAQLGYASAPSDAFQVRLQAELRLAPELLAWVAALGISYSASSQRTAAADLGFRLLAAQAELCPLRVDGARVWLRWCGQLQGGAWHISVTARDASLDTAPSTRLWLAAGASLHAGLPLSPHWSLRALVAGSVMLVRDSFDVRRTVGGEPDVPDRVEFTRLYRPPPVSLELLLGAAYAF
jgi:hypothetical protein